MEKFVYATIYDNGRKIEKIPAALLREIRPRRFCRYKENVGFYGPIYSGFQLFPNLEAAQNTWEGAALI